MLQESCIAIIILKSHILDIMVSSSNIPNSIKFSHFMESGNKSLRVKGVPKRRVTLGISLLHENK
jgi:hypothetical protein